MQEYTIQIFFVCFGLTVLLNNQQLWLEMMLFKCFAEEVFLEKYQQKFKKAGQGSSVHF